MGSRGAGQVLDSTHAIWETRFGWLGAEEGLSQPVNIGLRRIWGASSGQRPEGSRPAQRASPEVHETSWFYQPGDSCRGERGRGGEGETSKREEGAEGYSWRP